MGAGRRFATSDWPPSCLRLSELTAVPGVAACFPSAAAPPALSTASPCAITAAVGPCGAAPVTATAGAAAAAAGSCCRAGGSRGSGMGSSSGSGWRCGGGGNGFWSKACCLLRCRRTASPPFSFSNTIQSPASACRPRSQPFSSVPCEQVKGPLHWVRHQAAAGHAQRGRRHGQAWDVPLTIQHAVPRRCPALTCKMIFLPSLRQRMRYHWPPSMSRTSSSSSHRALKRAPVSFSNTLPAGLGRFNERETVVAGNSGPCCGSGEGWPETAGPHPQPPSPLLPLLGSSLHLSWSAVVHASWRCHRPYLSAFSSWHCP